VHKADDRIAGVGAETVITSYLYRQGERRRFIPLVRDPNPKGVLPTYLGSALYIDFRGDNWTGEAFTALLNAIRRIEASPPGLHQRNEY
jgi:hypothetical protein